MTRKAAITGLSDQICSSVMEAAPHSASAVHHHQDQDTIVYGLQGSGAVVFDHGKNKQVIGPGESVPSCSQDLEGVDATGDQLRLTAILFKQLVSNSGVL